MEREERLPNCCSEQAEQRKNRTLSAGKKQAKVGKIFFFLVGSFCFFPLSRTADFGGTGVSRSAESVCQMYLF
jgi:hypothetical protein